MKVNDNGSFRTITIKEFYVAHIIQGLAARGYPLGGNITAVAFDLANRLVKEGKRHIDE